MNVDLLAAELTDGLEPPVSDVCMGLIHRFATIPATEQRRMSFTWLASLVDREWDDAIFQSAISAMTSVRNHPLILYFVMHDAVEDRELSIELCYVKESIHHHIFIHPTTGEEIPDFERLLVPVFRTSPAFQRRLHSADA